MGLFCKLRFNKDKFCCRKILNFILFLEGGGKYCLGFLVCFFGVLYRVLAGFGEIIYFCLGYWFG